MQPRTARRLYSLLLQAATPLYLARLWWRGRREPGYRERIGERLGYHGEAIAAEAGNGPLVWLHAVSLGETRASAPLIAALRERLPGLRLLLSCGTATGREAGRALLREGDRQVWLPYDTPAATARFMRRFRPAVGVLMETELWPNLLQAADEAGVPMVLANARLSQRSLDKGQRFSALLRPAVARLDAVLAQTDDDARRLAQAGARAVEVCGNLKFDVSPAPAQLAQGRGWRALAAAPGPSVNADTDADADTDAAHMAGQSLRAGIVLAASTREGEEAPLLAAWRALPAPRPRLVVVPRHPQRFDAVAQQIAAAGFRLARRSDWCDAPTAEALQAEVWLGDSLGEMALYYALADVALLGGSFAPLGGQNLIEAAACGCPVVMGPHTFNFAEAAQLAEQAGAALRVAEIEAGVALAAALCAEASRRDEIAARALAFSEAHRGAGARMAQRIAALVGT